MRSIWNRAKTWNSISIGPLAILFRLARKTKVSSNSLRKGIRNARILTVFKRDAPTREEDVPGSGRVASPTRTAVIVGVGVGRGMLARELWPMGIHVVHCVIDADIQESVTPAGDSPQSDPKDIAGFILGLHLHPRSAWTSEADLRPFNERFWEHC